MKAIFIAFIVTIAAFSSCNSSPAPEPLAVDEPLATETETEDKEAKPEAKETEDETKETEAVAEVKEEPQAQVEPAPTVQPPEETVQLSTETNPPAISSEPPPDQEPTEEEIAPEVIQPSFFIPLDPIFMMPESASAWTQSNREELLLTISTIETELENFEYSTLAEIDRVFEELTGQTWSDFIKQVRIFESDPDSADPSLLDAIDEGRRELTRTLNTIVERRFEAAEKEPPLFWDDEDKATFARAAENILDAVDSLSTQEYNRLAYFFNDATNGKRRLITLINELAAFVDNPKAADTGATTAVIDGLDLLVKVMSRLSN